MTRKVSATQDLAVYLWKDIQGKTEPPFSDPVFIRRYMSAAKKILKLEGIDVETVKMAMVIMKRGGLVAHSPQQTIDWTDRASGKSYYELAKIELAGKEIPPPVYDEFAYAAWMLQHDRGDELKGLL